MITFLFSASVSAAPAACIVSDGQGNFASCGVYTGWVVSLLNCFTLLFVHSGSDGKGYFLFCSLVSII